MGEVGPLGGWGGGGGGGASPSPHPLIKLCLARPANFPGTSVQDARGNFPIHYAADLKSMDSFTLKNLVNALGERR